MRVIRDIFLGLLAGILMCTGLVLFVPQGREMFESFVENTGIDVNHWLEDTKNRILQRCLVMGSRLQRVTVL